MTEPKPPGPLLGGRDEGTPARALGRVALVVGLVFVAVCALAYGLWSALN